MAIRLWRILRCMMSIVLVFNRKIGHVTEQLTSDSFVTYSHIFDFELQSLVAYHLYMQRDEAENETNLSSDPVGR